MALVLAGALLLAACSSDEASEGVTPVPTAADRSTTTTTTEPPTTTTEPKTVEDEVRDAYLAAEAAYFESLESPTDSAGTLSDHWTGAAHENALAVLRRLTDEATYAVYPSGKPVPPTVLSVSIDNPETATVWSCLVDNSQMTRMTDGAVVDGDLSSRLITSTLTRSAEVWKIAEVLVVQRWGDLDGCDR